MKDRYDWDKYIDFFQRTDEIEETQKIKLIDSFKILKEELGNGFLKHSIGKNHIIKNHVFMSSEESYSWLIWLAETLSYFRKRDCNYNELTKKLQKADDCITEGIPFLEIADAYRTAGFEVVFEPMKNSNKRNPDLKIINPQNYETFFIEITKLNDSKDRFDKGNIYQTVFYEFISVPIIPFAGKIIKKIEDNDLLQITSDALTF